MLKCISDIDIVTYFLSYLIIFISLPIIYASNVSNYSYDNNIPPKISNNQLQYNDNSNDIGRFLQKRVFTLFDRTDESLIDTSIFGISPSSHCSFNILSPLPTNSFVKSHTLQLKPPDVSDDKYHSDSPPDLKQGLPPDVPPPPTTLSQVFNPNPTFDSVSFISPPFPLPTLFHSPSHNRHCRPRKGNSTRDKPKHKPKDQKHDPNFDDEGDYKHYPGCDDYIPGFKPFLSDVLLQNVLEAYEDLCNATILTSGFISLSNNYTNITTLFNNTDYSQLFPPQRRVMLTSPSLLIQCSNDAHSDRPYHATNNNFTKFLIEVAQNYTNEYVIDDSSSMVYKDNFNSSVLIIIFSQTALCIAAWMMYLILLLLPASNYNNRNIFVHIYVLFYAITQSVFLAKAYNGVFKWEYDHCIQDSSKYEKHIVDLTGFKVCELLLNILSNINWAYIVIFMYNVDSLKNGITRHNSLSASSFRIRSFLEKGYLDSLPELKDIIFNKFKEWIYNPKNRTLLYIIVICIVLSAINNTFFAIILWKKTRFDLRAVYKASESLIYTLLLWRISLFILRNFGMTITYARTVDSLKVDNNSLLNNPMNHNTINPMNDGILSKNHMLLGNLDDNLKYFRRWISNIWKNYFNTIPLLIYNIVIYILSYFMIIYFTSISAYRYRWKYNLVYFTKLLITVNFWGLIGVLNRREIYLNKKTILGRRINNHDEFFVEQFSSSSSSSSLYTLPEQLSNGFIYCANSGTITTPNITTADTNKNSIIQQGINNNKNMETNRNLHNIRFKYAVSKPVKSLRSNFNRMKERRIHFAIEKSKKEKR